MISSVPVEWVGPDGTSLGRIGARAAYQVLLRRLETRLDRASPADGQRELQEGLARVQGWLETLAGSS